MTDEPTLVKLGQEAVTRIVHVDKQYYCPKCGYETDKNEGINISFEEYKGTYCIKCYAKWVAKNFPKMVKKEN